MSQRIWKLSARSPVPSRSPRAVKYGMEKLSGSRPRPHIQCTIQSAMYRRISTWRDRRAYSHLLSPGGARGHVIRLIHCITRLGNPAACCVPRPRVSTLSMSGGVTGMTQALWEGRGCYSLGSLTSALFSAPKFTNQGAS